MPLPEPESVHSLMCKFMNNSLAQTDTLEGGILNAEPAQGSPHRAQVSPAEEVDVHQERVQAVEVAAHLEEASSYAPNLLVTLEEGLAEGVKEAYKR